MPFGGLLFIKYHHTEGPYVITILNQYCVYIPYLDNLKVFSHCWSNPMAFRECSVIKMTQLSSRLTSWSGGSSSRSATFCPSRSASWRSLSWVNRAAIRSPTWRTALLGRWAESSMTRFLQTSVTFRDRLRFSFSWCWTLGMNPSSPTSRIDCKIAQWSWSTLNGWGKRSTLSWSSGSGSLMVRRNTSRGFG